MSTKNRVESNEIVELGDGDTEAGAMVPYQPQAAPVAPYNPLGKTGQFWANWDTSTPEGKMLVLRCRKNADMKAEDVIGEEFALARCFLHPAESSDDETGEVSQWVRIVLINAEGKTVSFGSVGILRDLSDIVSLWGQGPWDPPILVRVTQTQVGKRKRLYGLEIVGMPEFTKRGGRGGK